MKASDMLPRKVEDPKAETVSEMCASTLLGRQKICEMAKRFVEEGKWEQVYKRVGVKLVTAYRVKKR